MPHPGLVRIEPGQERSTRRAAATDIIELCESKPVLRQRIEVRRLDFPTEAADIRKPPVIGHDEKDIRTFGSRRATYANNEQKSTYPEDRAQTFRFQQTHLEEDGLGGGVVTGGRVNGYMVESLHG